VLGAIAEVTDKIGITTGLTCPIIRYHPAIIAQAAATIGVMSNGRFTLALGAGERLNEHIVGQGWPGVDHRHGMLREAIDIMRALWSGDVVSHSDTYFELETARIYDLPKKKIQIVVGASGEKSATLAAEVGAGLMAVEPKRELVQEWESAGGTGPCYGELALGYAQSKEQGLQLAHRYSRFGALGWNVLVELPSVAAFEEATQFIKPEDLRDSVPHGPDVDAYEQAVKKFTAAGFDHVVLSAIGPDQEGFMRFFKEQLGPRLRSLQ
jgi:G6PDH family F420-dependent oxidoreductase